MVDIYKSRLIDVLSGSAFAVSATISAFSASCETALGFALNTAQGHVCDGAIAAVVAAYRNVMLPYLSDIETATKLAWGLLHPVAPEALGMTDTDWDLLANGATPLYAYAESRTNRNVQADVFLAAVRVLTVASTLSYAEENRANQLLARMATRIPSGDRWAAEVVVPPAPFVRRADHHAQAMFLKMCATKKAAPLMILAFRGTELSEYGSREFLPEWLRNIHVTQIPVGNLGKTAQGFYNAWKGLEEPILRRIKSFSIENGGQDVVLFVTGHSAGGALAGASLIDLVNKQANFSFNLNASRASRLPSQGSAITSTLQT